jgi:hypothetical protein
VWEIAPVFLARGRLTKAAANPTTGPNGDTARTAAPNAGSSDGQKAALVGGGFGFGFGSGLILSGLLRDRIDGEGGLEKRRSTSRMRMWVATGARRGRNGKPFRYVIVAEALPLRVKGP